MRINEFDIGDVAKMSFKAWGSGEYPCLVLERSKGSVLIQHPNGKIYQVLNDARCCVGTEEEFLQIERKFDADRKLNSLLNR